jgi:hypothetical protein
VIRSDFLILLTTKERRSVTLSQCDITALWVTVPLTSVNSLPISLRVSIILILVTQILKISLAHGCGFSSIRLRMSNLEAATSGLDANKVPGNNGVPPSFVKLCAAGLKSPLLHIFNLSLSTGTFPSKWKNSFLIPIFKASKRNDVDNYRSVAILSGFAKFFEVTVFDYIFFCG